jgi:hypothetical protein
VTDGGHAEPGELESGEGTCGTPEHSPVGRCSPQLVQRRYLSRCSRHRDQCRDPRPAARQEPGRPFSDLQRGLPAPYSGAILPALIAGHLTSTFSLPQIALGYGGLALAATLVTVIAARNSRSG